MTQPVCTCWKNQLNSKPAVQERRCHPRFAVEGGQVELDGDSPALSTEGAFVCVRRRSVAGLLNRRRRLHDLRNLSLGGLCFESDQRFSVGQVVVLSLHVPQWTEGLELRARVAWKRSVFSDMHDLVGVEFFPFDGGPRRNAAAARDAIVQLLSHHAEG